MTNTVIEKNFEDLCEEVKKYPSGKVFELNETKAWGSIEELGGATTIGKKFREKVEGSNDFGIKIHSQKSNNHIVYERI